MGIWSWFKKSPKPGDPAPQRSASSPELVVLLPEPRVIGTHYLQQAIEFTFGVRLPTDEPKATEFVTGEAPIFHAQFNGRLLMVHYGHHPYFDPICAPFMTGDPAAILRSAERHGVAAEARASRGWIAVTRLGAAGGQANEDPYQEVARLLGALADVEDVVAILWPSRNEARQWADGMAEQLMAGDYQGVFRS
jgi:hypothetical protein